MFKAFVKKILLKFSLAKIDLVSDEKIRSTLNLLRPIKQKARLIRIGSDGDGGYLIPQIDSEFDACFSPGVSDNSDFELHLAKSGTKCFLADASVDSPAQQNELFHFRKQYVGKKTEFDFITLDDWIQLDCIGLRNGILQMDIEGFEYETLLSCSDSNLQKFSVIILELHNLNHLHMKYFHDLFNLTLIKLGRNFQIVHLHPNNAGRETNRASFKHPNVVEITLLRNDLCQIENGFAELPNLLDKKNRSDLPDLKIDFFD